MDLFSYSESKPIPVVDLSARPDDGPRLSRASRAVLEQLKRGPALGHQLSAAGGSRYGARIHDLRKAGYKIDAKHVTDGVWEYSLTKESNKCS